MYTITTDRSIYCWYMTCCPEVPPLKLVRPTDFDILHALQKTGRNVAANIAIHTGKDRSYLNTRFPHLEDYGLIRKIGPAENTGLYEITERGEAALALRNQYDSGPGFENLVDQYLSDDLDASDLEN